MILDKKKNSIEKYMDTFCQLICEYKIKLFVNELLFFLTKNIRVTYIWKNIINISRTNKITCVLTFINGIILEVSFPVCVNQIRIEKQLPVLMKCVLVKNDFYDESSVKYYSDLNYVKNFVEYTEKLI